MMRRCIVMRRCLPRRPPNSFGFRPVPVASSRHAREVWWNALISFW